MLPASYLAMGTALELIKYISGFSDKIFPYFTFHLFQVYTIGLQRFRIIASTLLNVFHRLSIRHTYSFTFNYFSSLHDQNSTILMSSEKILTVFTKLSI